MAGCFALRFPSCTSLRGNPFLQASPARGGAEQREAEGLNAAPRPVHKTVPAQCAAHLLFVLPKRRRSAPGPEEKGANALNLCTVTKLVIAIVGHLRLSGRNRGIGCRRCFRAEPLRLALPWAQDKAECFAHFPFLHVIASQCAHWRGNPFLFGRPQGSELRRERRSRAPREYPRGGPQAPFGRFKWGGS